MAKLTLVLGGAKSGKSLFAENLARHYSSGDSYKPGEIAYLATAEIKDEEMTERVLRHKKRRPEEWQTIETPLKPETAILGLDKNVKFLIIDCITLYITNLLLQYESGNHADSTHSKLTINDEIVEKIDDLCSVCKRINADVVMVSNEVGLSIVPDNKLARVFSDIAGQSNQIIAKQADEVYFVIAGIAQKIK
ncbi:MAG: bifunctional adenosylcobinamide kinase/adenosylcobinamide-phosphate guanylyltransferase [Candidatus Anammoxibacter sp.]